MEFQLRTKQQKRNHKILWLVLVGSFLILAIIYYIINTPDTMSEKFGMYISIIFLAIFFTIMWGAYIWSCNNEGFKNSKVILNEKGVDFHLGKKHEFIYWDDVEYVVITKIYNNIWIRLFAWNFKGSITKLPYNIYPRHSLICVSESYVYIPYSKEALDQVKKHFNKPVTDEYKLHLKWVRL